MKFQQKILCSFRYLKFSDFVFATFLLICSCTVSESSELEIIDAKILNSFFENELGKNVRDIEDKKILIIPINSCSPCVEKSMQAMLLNRESTNLITVILADKDKDLNYYSDYFSVNYNSEIIIKKEQGYLNYSLPFHTPILIINDKSTYYYHKLKVQNLSKVFSDNQLKNEGLSK